MFAALTSHFLCFINMCFSGSCNGFNDILAPQRSNDAFNVHITFYDAHSMGVSPELLCALAQGPKLS